jgi:hypothetical protein
MCLRCVARFVDGRPITDRRTGSEGDLCNSLHALEQSAVRLERQLRRELLRRGSGLGPERRRGSRPGQRDCPTGAPRAPRSTQRRLVGGLCRLGLRGARGVPNPRGTARNRGHRNAVVRARTMPNLQAFHGEESARADSLKIVVSPVRVRVSPSEEMPAGPATARRPWLDAGRGCFRGAAEAASSHHLLFAEPGSAQWLTPRKGSTVGNELTLRARTSALGARKPPRRESRRGAELEAMMETRRASL